MPPAGRCMALLFPQAAETVQVVGEEEGSGGFCRCRSQPYEGNVSVVFRVRGETVDTTDRRSPGYRWCSVWGHSETDTQSDDDEPNMGTSV